MFLIFILLIAVIAVGLSTYSRFYALLFLIPLSVLSQSSSVVSFGERGVNIGMDTIYILFFVLIEFAKGDNNKFKLNLNQTSFALLLCFAYFFLNALLISFVKGTGFSISGILVWLRLFQYVPVFIILTNLDIDFKESIKMFKAFIFTGLLSSFISLYQYLSGDFIFMKGMPSFTMPVFRETNMEIEAGNYMGSGNYNVYAAFMLIPIFLLILVWNNRKNILIFKKKLIFIYALILSVGIYLSGSRSAILAIILGFLSINFSFKRILASLKNLIYTAVLLGIIGYVYQDLPFIKNITDIATQFNEVLPYAMEDAKWNAEMGFSGDTFGAVVRIYTYSEAIRVFFEAPFFGCGFDSFLMHSNHYPENLFLQILAETGIVGFLLFINFMYKLYSNFEIISTHDIFNTKYFLIFQAIILALCFVNLTGGTLFIQKVWGPFLLLAGFFYGYQRTQIMKSK